MKNPRHIGNISSSNVSRELIRQVSDEEFLDLCARIRQRMCNSKSNASWNARVTKRKHCRKIVRRLQLVRHPRGERRVYTRTRHHDFKPSTLLDSLYPNREEKWIKPTVRKSKKNAHKVTLKNFSFLDNPIETMERLRDIAKAEAREFAFDLNFVDTICHDIGPYLLLGVIRQQMLPNCTGGEISGGLSKVLSAVQLDQFLGMTLRKHKNYDVFPFPLKSGAKESAIDGHLGVTTKQRVIDQFAETLDGWLHAVSLALSEEGRERIGRIIGESIDNAERHSGGVDEKGQWWFTGFMTIRPDGNGGHSYHCHVALLSLGCSIASSIAKAPDKIQEKIAPYANKHKSRRQSKDTLTTVYALQDGITREPPGGIGLMDLFDMASALGQTKNGINAAVAILSGDACIMASSPYIVPTDDPNLGRRLWFNQENSLEKPPERDYVFTLPYNFPGTLVTLRFEFDPEHLRQVAVNNGNTRP